MVAWLKGFYPRLSREPALSGGRGAQPCGLPGGERSLPSVLPGCCFGASRCGLWGTHEDAAHGGGVQQNHRAFRVGLESVLSPFTGCTGGPWVGGVWGTLGVLWSARSWLCRPNTLRR